MDVRAPVAEPEIADVAILAAVRGYQENVVQKELAHTSSSGPVDLRASAAGAVVRLHEGKHGTVLFLAWSRGLYTTEGKIVRRRIEPIEPTLRPSVVGQFSLTAVYQILDCYSGGIPRGPPVDRRRTHF